MRVFAVVALVAAFAVAAQASTKASCTCTGCSAGGITSLDAICNNAGGSFSSSGSTATCSGSIDCTADTIAASCTLQCAFGSGCSFSEASCTTSSKCFPAHATVQLEDGSVKTMAALKTGDRVLVGNNEFSDVYMFSHQDADAVTNFVKIAAEKHTLMLTPDHYLYVNGHLATAKTVKAGDFVVDAQGKQIKVASVSTVRSSGLYNPHTMTGDVIVNGIKTSTYTEAIAPALAHAALWPVRMAYSMGQDIVGGAFAEGSELVANALPAGKTQY